MRDITFCCVVCVHLALALLYTEHLRNGDHCVAAYINILRGSVCVPHKLRSVTGTPAHAVKAKALLLSNDQ